MTTFERYTDHQAVLDNMVEVIFTENTEDGFRKVKETMERMGIAKRGEKKLFQSAHILHKQGRYYIAHYKLMLALDGREVEFPEGDRARMNLIVKYLKDWNLVNPVSENWETPMASPRALKVIKHSEKPDWEICPKYSVGSKKGNS